MQQNNQPVDIVNFVSEWNAKYPFDYLWRKKYNVPFGSKQHLETSHVNMMIDLYEEANMRKLMDKFNSREFDASEYEQNRYDPTFRNTAVRMSQDEIDSEFDNLDLSQFNDTK